MPTSFIIAEDSQKLHDADNIPEGIDRITAVLSAIKKNDLFDELDIISAIPATVAQVEAAHDHKYVEAFQESLNDERKRLKFFTSDAPIIDTTYQAALLSAGALITAIDNIADGGPKKAFCLTRPPGHHAESGRGMGFCYFNNIAIAAYYLLNENLASRVAIVDIDVHHGNGTQQIFYENPNVLVCNVHRDPRDFYPYQWGFENEYGEGAGKGFNLNIPLSMGSRESDYLAAMREILVNIAKYKPDWILVSAGFDAHKNDPMRSMLLESSSYGKFAELLCRAADVFSKGRLVSVLEGGYNREALGESVCAYVRGLLNYNNGSAI